MIGARGSRLDFYVTGSALRAAAWLALITLLFAGEFAPGVAGAGEPPVRAVFAGYTEGGSWDLWLASGDGAHLRRAVETPSLDERTPVLSADRARVAFAASDGQLRVYDIRSRVLRVLPTPSSGRAAWPVWDPADITSIYYVDVLMGKGPDEGRIWKLNIDSGKRELVADEPEVEGWPAISEDGVLLFTTWTQSQTSHMSIQVPGAAAPKRVWDSSLSLSGAAHLKGGGIAAVAADSLGQKVLMLNREGRLEREIIVPGASGRPAVYENGTLLLTRIDGGAATIHVLNTSSGTTHSWIKSPPIGLAQMRDADYR